MTRLGEHRLLLGTPIARRILEGLSSQVAAIRAAKGTAPALATVLVANGPASTAYLRAKDKRCAQVGIVSRIIELPKGTTQELVGAVRTLACDPSVHAILVQHPVPAPIDKRAVFEAIPLAKDVDGVSSASLGRVIVGMPAFPSCTPAGIMRILTEYEIRLDGVEAVVVGRSPILGRPMASMLINAHATVTLCHSRTRDLPGVIQRADILIVAVGRPRFVQGSWIKPGAIVIDAGYNEGNVGDVDFEPAARRAAMITPVPGGVGPMTVAMLLEHTVLAAADQLGVGLEAPALRAVR